VNLLLRSEEFDNAGWLKSNATVTANATTSPDGTANADKLVEDSSNTSHFIRQNATGVIGTAYTSTLFLKAAERTAAVVVHFDGAAFCGVSINLLTGALSTPPADLTLTDASATSSVQAFGNGWYRVTVTRTQVTSTTLQSRVFTQSGSNGVYTGNGTSGIFLYGAQLEAGAFATSYIPTVASTVTRAADIAVMSGSNFSSWYNQSEGTIVAQATAYGNKASSVLVRIQDATAVTNFIAGRQSATGTQMLGQTSSSGGLTAGLAGTNFTLGVPFVIAVACAPSNIAASVNGGTVGTSTAMTTMPVVDRLNISEGGPFHIRSITYYATRLTNAQLQALTS
jgi:hypothetical protein